MAQRSHVPKFGSWDKDNIPYTVYFENARKEKANVKMNPNDPEENPEAFMYGREGMESAIDFSLAQTPLHPSAHETCAERHQHRIEGHKGHIEHWRNPSDNQKSADYKSTKSESGSDKSNSDHSLMKARYQCEKSYKSNKSESGSDKSNSDHSMLKARYQREKTDWKRALAAEGSNSLSASTVSRHSRQKSGSYPSDDSHHGAASVPRFGAWDETDPKSGEGFTEIFNRVKLEKQIATDTTYPSVPPQPINHSDNQRNKGSSSGPKFYCCLFSCGRE